MLNFSCHFVKMESQDIFDDPVAIQPNPRVEVFRNTITLKLKVSDVTVERLARIFKVLKAATHYSCVIPERSPGVDL